MELKQYLPTKREMIAGVIIALIVDFLHSLINIPNMNWKSYISFLGSNIVELLLTFLVVIFIMKSIRFIKELQEIRDTLKTSKEELENEIREIKQERKFINYVEDYRARKFYNTMCAAIPIYENGKKTEGYTHLHFYVSDNKPMAITGWSEELKKERDSFNDYLKELDLVLSETERNKLIEKYCL